MSANYVQDATDAAPIAHYEETDEDFAEFAHAWCRSIKDDHDWDDYAFVNRAEEIFNFAYGYAEYANGAGRAKVADTGQTIVFRIPGWFANDELGQWEEFWFGNFEVAKEDDDGEWTAFCVSDIEPLGDRHEDSYFRNAIEEEWLPFSLVEMAFVVTPETTDDHLIFDRGLDSDTIDHERGEKADADIVVEYGSNTQYGRKFVLDSPFEAKDDLKALDWEQFHPNWNGDNWEIDADALWPFIEEMTLQGWSVCVADVVENETTDDSLAEGPYLPAEAKRGEN